jgi:sugar phosphate permease
MLTIGWACMVYVNIGYLTWMPSYLHETFGLSLANAGFSSMFYHHVAAFAGVIVGGMLSDQLAKRNPSRRPLLQGFALLAGAPFLYLLGTGAGQGLVFLALAGFGFFRGIYDAGIYASFFEVIEPRLRATVIGLVIACVYLFGALAPVVLAVLKGHVGMAAALSLLSISYVGGGVALLVGAIVLFARDHQAAGCAAGDS